LGPTNDVIATVEVYDPRSATWRVRPSLPTARASLASGAVNGKLYAIGGSTTASRALTGNESYVPGDVWVTKSKMPTAREEFAAAAVGGKFYALGGRLNGGAIAANHAYDPGANRWTSRTSMPQPRAGSNGAGVINGIVYVPGGQGTDGVYTNSLYAYNPATNAWTSKANMPAASGCGGSGVIGGKLYVYAICRADGSSQSGLYVYDPATNTWGGRISELSQKFPAVAVVDSKLYLAGGLNAGVVSSEASSYDLATNEWTSLPPMAVARYAATAVGVNGLLYVIGGYTAFAAPLATVEVYNPATNTWRTVTGMPTARWWPGAGAINGKVYAVGGHGEVTLTTTEVYTP